MIIFEFQIDETELEEQLESDITNFDFGLFSVTLFIMPVRLNINGIEFFRHGRTNGDEFWASFPILELASYLLETVKSLPEIEIQTHQLPAGGIFVFELLSNNTVSVSYNNITTVVSYEDLLRALEDFAANTRKFFKERVPQLNLHTFWGRWLREEFD